jgi:hypothetical protein
LDAGSLARVSLEAVGCSRSARFFLGNDARARNASVRRVEFFV